MSEEPGGKLKELVTEIESIILHLYCGILLLKKQAISLYILDDILTGKMDNPTIASRCLFPCNFLNL